MPAKFIIAPPCQLCGLPFEATERADIASMICPRCQALAGRSKTGKPFYFHHKPLCVCGAPAVAAIITVILDPEQNYLTPIRYLVCSSCLAYEKENFEQIT